MSIVTAVFAGSAVFGDRNSALPHTKSDICVVFALGGGRRAHPAKT
ncbi:MAG: hypothetical protein ACBR12_15890 [Microcoleus sp.]|nr:hypothetical protein [Tychonema bourrellyi]MDQ2099568.1 hypothetical protein [Tychonema bourrellyi B0820]